ncbi:MAG: succinate dehydrogenase assembly factor 4 [Hyphomicrobium sp.]|jgi:hypothetical protein
MKNQHGEVSLSAAQEKAEPGSGDASVSCQNSKRPLSPAAQRALAEAEARRAAAREAEAHQPPSAAAEIGGRDGPEPTRYGDWEKGGIVSDF